MLSFLGVRVFSSMDDIPLHPTRNWVTPGLNNFRQNKQPGLEFAAADAWLRADQ